ncbi:DHA2 family efflux MFS transporter permease subunit [Micromonospora sp. SL1-18]|uniref:DHA2 family efflux MFS transporter permease subunit n=1 Tax=Micromonospora sp. SL1-18 TaxID=3399128 RepID=UPI003A4E371C
MARRWKVLLVTSSAVFMALLDVTIVNIAFPDMRRSFPQDSLSTMSWIINAYNVIFAAALVPAGRLADRIGRRRMFLAGLLIFLAASLACGLAINVEFLIGARIVQALGAALVVPTSLSLVLPEFPPERRATATALWTATGAIAAATGPSLGGVLVHWQGWRLIFLVNLLIGLAALVPSLRLLRESRETGVTRWPDAVGAILLAGAVGLLALALVNGADWGWRSFGVVGSLIAAAILSVLFLARSARHPVPVVDPELFRIRSFAVANVGSLVFGAGFYALLLTNVLFLTSAWQYDIFLAGVALTVGPMMAAVAAVVSGRLADKYGQRAITVPGGLVFAAGALILGLTTTGEPRYFTIFLPATLLTGMGAGLCLPSFGSAAVAELPRNRYATGVAVASCFRQIGAVVGVAGLVAVLGATGRADTVVGFQRAYLLVALAGVLTTIVASALGRVRARDVADLPGRPVLASSSPDRTPAALGEHPAD